MYHPQKPIDIFHNEKEKKIILTGSEAFARGLFEASVQFYATYPGTPASEIGDNWKYLANQQENIQFDLSPNEAVAIEAAIGASWSGVRASVGFKHLGLNLAADALHTIMYSGIEGKRKAGFVILCGGDPAIQSSTNAQDIRLFSFHTKLPILEPTSIEECKNFTKLGFNLSEKWNLPIMIYTPSQINHGSGIVECNRPEIPLKGKNEHLFHKNPDKFLNALHWAQKNQIKLNSIIYQIKENASEDILYEIKGNFSQTLQIQTLSESNNSNEKKNAMKIGFISSGASWSYCEEICHRIDCDLPRLRYILTYPLQKEPLIEFIEKLQPDILIIVEEQEAFLERQIKEILYDEKINIQILAKPDFPAIGNLSPDIIMEVLGNPIVLRGDIEDEIIILKNFSNHIRKIPHEISHFQEQLPIREPTFCPGCSHRNVFYALKKATSQFEKKNGIKPVYGGDIGCYTMSMSKPFETMDWLICMGAGVGIANGVGRLIDPTQQHLIAMIGDSTFFHSGIQPIFNLAKDNVNVLVIILDNYYTAMTGHQPSPSTPLDLIEKGYDIQRNISIPAILKSMGNYPIQRLDGFSIKKMERQFSKLFQEKGLKFALVTAECALNKKRRLRAQPPKESVEFSSNKQKDQDFTTETIIQIQPFCTQCDACFRDLGCPAIQDENGQYTIDISRCARENCESCLEICPNHAIYKTIISRPVHSPKNSNENASYSKNKDQDPIEEDK